MARIATGPSATELTAPPLAHASLALASTPASADAIFARSPFDSEHGRLSRPSAARAPSEPELDPQLPSNAPPCVGLQLMVSAAATDAAASLASFQLGDGKNVLGRRGDDIAGKRLEYIGWDRAWLTSDGRICQTELYRTREPKLAEPVPAPLGAVDPSIGKGIRKRSATEFEIDRSVLDRIVDNNSELLKMIRVVPDKQGEQVKGLKLLGIKSGSLLSLLGLENGDRLQTINGFDVTSPERALEAYARLRAGADQLRVKVERGGAPLEIDYDVR